MGKTTWTPELHEEILLAFVKVGCITGIQYAAVLSDLHANGHTFSESALKYAPSRHDTYPYPFSAPCEY